MHSFKKALPKLRSLPKRLLLGMRRIITLDYELSELSAKMKSLELGLLQEESNWHARQFLNFRDRLMQRLPVASEECSNAVPQLLADIPIEKCFRLLEKAAPRGYRIWRELVDVNKNTYEGFPVHSCSVEGHPKAELFQLFLRPHLRGAVLDIGCGPQPVPCYLNNYPLNKLAGIDPLLPATEHPFVFVQGVAEFLPWSDSSFDTVVVSTSLDHVFLLDKVFQEIHRVLRPDGSFITWITFVPGARKYDPYSDDVAPIDQYHLFHFDKPWFDDMIKPYFVIADDFVFRRPDTSSFLCLRKNSQVASLAA